MNITQSHHLIEFDNHEFTLLVSIHPKAYRFLTTILCDGNSLLDELAQNHSLCRFKPPNKSNVSACWGFGDIFAPHKKQGYPLSDWITWKCILPKGPRNAKELSCLSASMYVLTTVLGIFADDFIDIGRDRQLLTIDSLPIFSDETRLNGGSFSFTYSKEALEFCERIWKNANLVKQVVKTMDETFYYLTGKNKNGAVSAGSHFIQGKNLQTPVFVVPGNGSYTIASYGDEEGGRFESHNVDTEEQRWTLLAGIITLASMAHKCEVLKKLASS